MAETRRVRFARPAHQEMRRPGPASEVDAVVPATLVSAPHIIGLQRDVCVASFAMLALANLAGLWMATILVWPQLGALAGPLTYGRWAPVHLDLHLFGWSSLPAVGLLLARLLPEGPRAAGFARIALAGWVGALLGGAVAWLGGGASGKLFLDWTGPAAWVFAGAQTLLWLVLAGGWVARGFARTDSRGRRIGDLLLVLALAGVPAALIFAEQVDVYPPVNPDSGGATGHSLLASTLGVVGIALALPALLGRPARRPMRWPAISFTLTLVANWVLWAALRHGNETHRDLEQVVGLGSLVVWPVYLVWWFRQYTWEPAHRLWLVAMAAWAALLFLDGWGVFLPGVLEVMKFTNALVAHSHLAMAGLFTSLNMVVLVSLAPRSKLAGTLAARGPWLAWNGAVFGMVAVLTGLGWAEGHDVMLVPGGAMGGQVIYVVRMLLGFVMFAVSFRWLWQALGRNASSDAARPASAAIALKPDQAHVS